MNNPLRLVDKVTLTFKIEKNKLNSIMGSSDLIPLEEIHILNKTGYEKALRLINPSVSVALIARANRNLIGNKSYIVSYIENVSIKFKDIQARPIMVQDSSINRALNKFNINDFYELYEIDFITPLIDFYEFLDSKNVLSTSAAPHPCRRDEI
jgi:hypothetical protein